MAHIKLEVVTPTGKALEVTAASVTAPGALGEFTVLPQHRPGLVKLGGGAIRYEGPEGDGMLFVRGGLAEIRPDGVLVLADEATRPADIDRAEAEAILSSVTTSYEEAEFLDDERMSRLASDRAYAESLLKVGH